MSELTFLLRKFLWPTVSNHQQLIPKSHRSLCASGTFYYRNSVLKERSSNRVPISELGFDIPSDPKRKYAYINEHLSPDMKRLLYLARCKKVDKNWAKVWVNDGKILAKKTADGDRYEITQEPDLKCFNN